MAIEELLFTVAEALRIPVLVLALVALALALVEAGILTAEIYRRSRRSMNRLEAAVDTSRAALVAGDEFSARIALGMVSWSKSMRQVMDSITEQRHHPDPAVWMAKRMADYDHRCLKRLERTRILVRAGPALGLMGTLIPLSPALAGLAAGDVEQLTENLRVAFGVTVIGLIIGAIAFGVSLIRDRLYSQDYSDVEYAAAELGPERLAIAAAPLAAVTPHPQPSSPRPAIATPTPSSQPPAAVQPATPPPVPPIVAQQQASPEGPAIT